MFYDKITNDNQSMIFTILSLLMLGMYTKKTMFSMIIINLLFGLMVIFVYS